MATNFKNFKNGFRIKPLADPSTDVNSPSEGDVTFKTGGGLQIYADLGAGPGWQQLLVAGSEADSQLLTTKILNKSNTSSYEDKNEGSPSADKIAIFYASSVNDSRYTTNVAASYAASTITEKTLILDMISGASASDVITQAYVYLPQGIAGIIGQTFTIQRQDSYKQTYTNKGESEVSIRVFLHTDGATQQQVNATGYTYQDSNNLSGQELLDYVDIQYNCTKLTFMWNGTNWILLNSIADHKHMLPIGSVIMSVLTETEFNWETAGIWKICDGGTLAGSRLAELTGWTKTPDLVGSEPTTLCPSQTSYPANRIAEPLVGDVNVARGVAVDAANNIIGARIADSTKTDHLDLELAVSSTNSDGDGTYSTDTDGTHVHDIWSEYGTGITGYRMEVTVSSGTGSATSSYVKSTNSAHNHSIDIPSHTHSIDDADFTTKNITNHHAADLTRPYTVLFNFFIRID